jgi:hypothetical protein
MIPPELDDLDLALRLRKLLALEIDRIVDDLSLREEWLVDTWSRHRDRGPFLDTVFSRYRTLTMTDLTLVDTDAVVACEAFYRELEELRQYFRFTQDMPATLGDHLRDGVRRMEAYGRLAIDALGGAPPRPVLDWDDDEKGGPSGQGQLFAPRLEVIRGEE